MSQPGRGTAALHRRNGMVHQALHEHAAALSTADHANRSRRLIKCAKDSGHYRRRDQGRCRGSRVKVFPGGTTITHVGAAASHLVRIRGLGRSADSGTTTWIYTEFSAFKG